MFKCPEFPWQLFIGKDIGISSDISQSLQQAQNEEFDFIQVSLSHPRFSKDSKVERSLPFTRSDYTLPDLWNRCVIGKLSHRINPDSPNPLLRKKWEDELLQQLRWAIHLGVYGITLPTPAENCANYARIINHFLAMGISYQNLQVEIPIDSWELWNKFRLMCGPSGSLGVSLVMTKELPGKEELDRWLGEPVMNVVIKPDVFITNKHGYPIFTKAHQKVMNAFFRRKVFVIIGPSRKASELRPYICYLFKNQPPLTYIEQFDQDYLDVLQEPLQPLMENLERNTYETFEKDPVKYRLYEEAIYKAMTERDVKVVMVLGAGRGPLVRAAFRAADRAKIIIKMYVIEKNPNAIITLKNAKLTEWKDRDVEIIQTDMRNWTPEQLGDIMVSELLGSFGDNELEPECLTCATKLLKPNGISIPCGSQSYLTPVSSQKVWIKVKDIDKKYECPYVVKMGNAWMPFEPQKVFDFSYPSLDSDFTRYSTLTFKVSTDMTIHGMVGYFESYLYKEIMQSILPATYSKDMISWYPIYFPINKPLFVTAGQDIQIHIWRCSGVRKVWYEWCVNILEKGRMVDTVGIHNPAGISYWIGK